MTSFKKKKEKDGEKEVPAADRRRDFFVFAAIVLLALAVRLSFQWNYEAKLGIDTRRSPELDCHTFDVWARRVAAGDLLSRDMYHPWHWWAQEIAPLETWNRWYGEKTFHQAPAYPYLVALAYAVFGAEPNPMPRVQAAIGSLSAGLAFLLARRYLPRAPSAVAALLVALNGPLVFDEAHLLRENLLLPAVLLAVIAADRACRLGTVRAFAAAGAALGFSMLVKESQILFAPVLVAAAFLCRHPAFPPEARPRRLRALAAAALAFLLVLTPVFARNAAVGASFLSISTRGPEVIVAGNAASSDGIEWFPERTREALLERDAKRILNEADGRLLPTLVKTLETHRDEPAGFLLLQLRKLDAFLNGFEVPNNVDFRMMRLAFPILSFLPDFSWIGPLALLGIFFAFATRRARLLAVPLLTLLVATVTTVGFFIVARFRAPFVPVFAVMAGVAVDAMARFAAERRRGALAASGAALALLAAYEWPRGESDGEARLRFSLAGLLLDSGRVDAAVTQFRDSIRAAAQAGEEKNEVLARSLLAKVLLEIRGDLAGAEAEQRAILAVARDPVDRGPALVSLGNILFRECWEKGAPPATQLPLAARCYADALASDPGKDAKGRDWVKTAHYGLAALLLYSADVAPGLEPDAIARAAEAARLAVAEDPEYGAAHVVLGRALLAEGRREEGIESLRRSLGLFSPEEAATKAQAEAILRGLGVR